METIILALKNTPWWVYLLFGFILYKGIRSLKTRNVSLKKLFIVPSILIFISFHTILTQISLNFENIVLLLVSFFAGVAIGGWMIKNQDITIDKESELLRVPGGYSTFVMIMLVFIIKYYMGYEEATDPNMLKQDGFETFAIIATSLLGGLFGGKMIGYLYHYKTSRNISPV